MHRRNITLALVVLSGLLTLAPCALAQSRGEVREEFHQTYPLAAGGRVSLENITGAVHITAWDRNEVRVDAVKSAYTPERLAEAEIRVEATSDAVSIKTKYPSQTTNWSNDEERRYRNPASVEYTLTVPRTARLESIELINGPLDIEGVAGNVRASSINGRVMVRGLAGEAKLSTINGPLEVTFDRLDESKPITLNSVNGSVILTIPSDANAHLKANTVHGTISNDFGLPVRRGEYVGRDLEGTLGRGGTRIKLTNVNGRITIQHAADGRPISAVTNLLPEAGKDPQSGEFEMRIQREVSREVERAMRDSQHDIARETERATREAQHEIARAAREAAHESQRSALESRRDALDAERAQVENDVSRLTERESKTFSVSGVPNVTVKTFDGPINVHAWDQAQVMFTALKRASNEQAMRAIQLHTEQRDNEVSMIAEFDKSYRPGNTQASVELEVYVPRSTNLHATSGDGRLRIEGINGDVEARTGDGSVDVRDGRGRLRVNTGDGRIIIANFAGEAEARTGDGRITLDGRFTQLAARTRDGSISLTLPADTNATIETNAESVVNSGLAVAEDTNPSKRVRRWRVGSGGNVFTLGTGDGQIILRRAGNTGSSATVQ